MEKKMYFTQQEIKECFDKHFVVNSKVATCVGWKEFQRLSPELKLAVVEYRNARYKS